MIVIEQEVQCKRVNTRCRIKTAKNARTSDISILFTFGWSCTADSSSCPRNVNAPGRLHSLNLLVGIVVVGNGRHE